MQIDCVSCKKKTKKPTGNKDAKVIKMRNGRLQMKSICNLCEHKKSRFVSKREGSGLLFSLEIRTPLNKIPILNRIF